MTAAATVPGYDLWRRLLEKQLYHFWLLCTASLARVDRIYDIGYRRNFQFKSYRFCRFNLDIAYI